MSYTLDFITQPPIDASDPSVITVDVITRSPPAIVLDAQGLGPPGPRGPAGPAGGVDSVDGRSGVVTLGDKYVDTTGDTMSGPLVIDLPAGIPLTIKAPAMTAASIGADVAINGAFTTDLTGWTVGANWAWAAGTAKHTVGAVASLTQDVLTIGTRYRATVTITGRTAGYVRLFTGASNVGGGQQTASFTAVFLATAAQLLITPSTDFDGAIDLIVVEVFNPVPANLTVEAPAGAIAAELRAGVGGPAGTYLGADAGMSVTTATSGTAFGTRALRLSSTGNFNTAIGAQVLGACVTGAENTGVGGFTLTVATGSRNTGIGYSVLGAATTAVDNVGVGRAAGWSPAGLVANATTTGQRQTLIGTETGVSSPTQADDVVTLGYRALVNGAGAIAIGSGASAGAAGAVAIGRDSASTPATTTTADEIRLGTALHTVRALGVLALGTNPATTGMVRLPNDQAIVARNAGNTADVPMLKVSAAGAVQYWNGTAWANVGGSAGTPPGTELAYAVRTTPLTVTVSADASAQEVIAGTAITYDGTPVMVEFFCPSVMPGSAAHVNYSLWDGATAVGILGTSGGGGVSGQPTVPAYVKRKITPTAGSHTYRICAAGPGSPYLSCGTGAALTDAPPAFMRITKA